MAEAHQDLQRRIGGRVRQGRSNRGATLKILAAQSGLSVRFLSDVESGKANISIGKLAQLATALDVSITSLIQPTGGGPRQAIDALLTSCNDAELVRIRDVIEVTLGKRTPRIIGLLGVRGAGKSTVGQQLASELGLPFVELGTRIEARAGMPIGDIFTSHGEPHYRALELECLAALVDAGRPCVVALTGGIVGYESAFNLVRESCTSVWLKATADDYWSRVHAQGDTRPMAGRKDAMADLRRLITRRNPLYQQADLVFDTSHTTPDATAAAILTALEASGRRP